MLWPHLMGFLYLKVRVNGLAVRFCSNEDVYEQSSEKHPPDSVERARMPMRIPVPRTRNLRLSGKKREEKYALSLSGIKVVIGGSL